MVDLLLEHGSYAGIIVLLILTGVGLPLPEELFVIGAGIAASQGTLNPWLALASCLIGGVLGDYSTYWIGHHFGRNVLREHHWFTRYVTPEREREMERMIELYGLKVLFAARFLVGVRSPVYLAAGISGMPFARFALIDALCATSVISTFFGLSYLFGDQIKSLFNYMRRAELALTVSVVLSAVAVGVWFYVRHQRRLARERQLRHDAADSTAESHPPHTESNTVGTSSDTPDADGKAPRAGASNHKETNQSVISHDPGFVTDKDSVKRNGTSISEITDHDLAVTHGKEPPENSA
jgi:membrane protein DedA with SNARE-associated domain